VWRLRQIFFLVRLLSSLDTLTPNGEILDEELEEQKKWKLKNTELPFLDLAAQMSDQNFVCFAHAFISEPT
jgi:hypothetical protein